MSNPMTSRSLFLFASLLCAVPFGAAGCSDHPKEAQTQAAPAAQYGDGGFAILNPESARDFYFDFKNVVFGEHLRHVYKLKNKEGRPLVIRDMLPSCGCTQPRVSYLDSTGARVEGRRESGQPVLTVPKDAEVDLAVEIDTTLVERMNMDKLTTVRVRTDSATNPYLMLELHLVVVRAFRAVPAKVELFDTPQTAGKSGRADITTDLRGNGSRIKKIDKVEGTFTAELQESQINGETDWILTVTAPPGLPLGPAKGSVTLTTTNADGKGDGAPFTVPILAQVVTDVICEPIMLAKSDVESAAGATLKAEVQALVPGARVKVLDVALEGTDVQRFHASTKPVSPDENGSAAKHALELEVPAGTAIGTYAGKVVVAIDAPMQSKVEVPFTVTVR